MLSVIVHQVASDFCPLLECVQCSYQKVGFIKLMTPNCLFIRARLVSDSPPWSLEGFGDLWHDHFPGNCHVQRIRLDWLSFFTNARVIVKTRSTCRFIGHPSRDRQSLRQIARAKATLARFWCLDSLPQPNRPQSPTFKSRKNPRTASNMTFSEFISFQPC